MGEGTQRGRGLAAVRAWASGIWRFDGRIGRRQFWNGVGLLLLAYLGFIIMVGVWLLVTWGADLDSFIVRLFTSWPIYPLYALELYWLLALCSKRWRDLGRSGWGSIGFVAPPPIAYMVAWEWAPIGLAGIIILLVCAAFFVWTLVLLGVVKGEGTPRGRGAVGVRAWAYGIWRFDGRVGRRQFWNGVGLLALSSLVFGVIEAGWLFVTWRGDLDSFIVRLFTSEPIYPLYALELYWLLALCAKRWRDLGRSGWGSIGLVVPPPIAYMAAEGAVQNGFDRLDAGAFLDAGGVLSVVILFVCAAFFVWTLVLLGVVKGEGTPRGRGAVGVRAWALEIWRFEGRIGREQFWNGVGLLLLALLGFIIIGVVWFFVMWSLAFSGIDLGESGILLAWVPLFLLAALELYWLLALCAKRWHDLGRSGRWSIGLFVPPPIAYIAAEVGGPISFDGLDAGGVFSVVILVLCAVFFVWALVLVGVVKGRVSEL